MTENKENLEIVVVSINGQKISAPRNLSIIQAFWHAGNDRIKGAGCLGGVCGSCRVLVQRTDSATSTSSVSMELACQTHVEDGMQAIFPPFPEPSPRPYQLSELGEYSEVQPQFHRIFPEASQCRQCGGCTESCPKGINVEQGVLLAADGCFSEAGELFFDCIMCDACTTACPELIDPNYVGLFARRATAYFRKRPSNLKNRLEQLRHGELTVIEPTDQSAQRD